MDKNGTITFTTVTALALWKHEVLGQLSDGAWENTGPHDHWKFWSDLDSAVGTENKVTMNQGGYVPYRQKTGYNIACLYEYVCSRMLGHGRMARALGRVAEEYHWIVETLQELGSLEAFIDAKNGPGGYVRGDLAKVDIDDAEAFYDTMYTMRDLRMDVKRIKDAMKTVRR